MVEDLVSRLALQKSLALRGFFISLKFSFRHDAETPSDCPSRR